MEVRRSVERFRLRTAADREGPASVDPDLRSCLRILRAQVIPLILPILLISSIVRVVNQVCRDFLVSCFDDESKSFSVHCETERIFLENVSSKTSVTPVMSPCEWPSAERGRQN